MSHARRADWAANVPWSGILGKPASLGGDTDIGELTGAGFSIGDIPEWNGTKFVPVPYIPGGGSSDIANLDSPGVATKRVNPNSGQIEQVWLREVFDVRQYGADNTGGTDATGNFNSAITALNAAGGGALIIPAGRYTVSGTLNRILGRCWVHGDGQGSTIITFGADGWWVTSGSFFGCTGLTMIGSSAVATGIKIMDSASRDNFLLTDLRITGFGYSISVDTVNRAGWIERVRLEALELALSLTASDSFVRGISIYNGGDNTKNAFEMTGYRNQVSDFKLLGEAAHFKKGLFVNDGGNHLIAGGMVIGCEEEAISLSNGTGGVSGCQVQNISWLDIGTDPNVVSYDATTNWVGSLYEIGTAGPITPIPPTPGSSGSIGASVVENFRDAFNSPELFTLPNGVNEFDLIYSGGLYYFAYDDKTQTQLRSASTLAGLSSASDTTPVVNGRYPSIQLDGSTWHLWAWDAGSLTTKHYTAPAFTGPYTFSDAMPVNFADVHVRILADGKYYAGYKDISASPAKIGCMQATSYSGPWTDLGHTFDTIGIAFWHSVEEADPAFFSFNGRSYVTFSGYDGFQQRCAIAEVDPVTLQAVFPPVVLVNPLEAWQNTNSSPKVFNPVFLAIESEPGRERLFYSQNPNAFSITTGWGYIESNNPPNDGRREQQALLLDAWHRIDLSTGIPITLHGSGTVVPDGLVTTAATGGAYGWIDTAQLDDFTFTVEFTAAVFPTAGNFALLGRLSTTNSAANPIIGLWIRNNAGTIKLYSEIHNNAGSGNYSTDWTTVLNTGQWYRATIRKLGSAVVLYLDGAQETSGSHSGSLTTLSEWALSNQKGISQAASQGFEGTIHAAKLACEGLPLSQL